MARRQSKSDQEMIIRELSWVHYANDSTRCSCRHMKCIKDTGHDGGNCPNPPTSEAWSNGRAAYFCDRCREYQDGSKQPVAMTTRG